ncbi:cell wall-binding repeat-containing protein [Romboutsia sedimentorum]|uniref:Cell wall-binding repeat-containing protein n=1 Tax=Romboutsia sedimentorum TaxID=1368474 RepID=A0ABT7E7N1_9FIRM|nr:cell wall-binding repeat-containing protein [Romboutsia sedimentorum]MDK2562940.1 cell wall-binding repeat-containing protein [Romboutsia sedimentorum]
MSKKKSIAMAMAVATVATTAAPAFAAPIHRAVVDSTNETAINEMKEKAYKMFQKKFTENVNSLQTVNKAGTNAYTVQLQVATLENVTIGGAVNPTNYADFVKELDKLVADLKEGQKILVTSTFNGRELTDGQIVDWKETKLADVTADELGFTEGTDVGTFKADKLADGTPIAKIRISDDNKDEKRYITVKAGDAKLDLDKPVYKQVNGHYVDKDGNSIAKVDNTIATPVLANGVIEGYQAAMTTPADAVVERDAILKDASSVQNKDMVVSDIYEVETGRLTVDGNELAKTIMNQRDHDDDKENVVITATDKDGVEYTYTGGKFVDATVAANELVEANASNVKFTFQKTDKVEATPANTKWETVSTVTVKGERKAPLSHILDMVKGKLDIYTAAGMDRYKTAVEVSKAFNKAANVVLVSGEEKSLVDGLTATPLAKKLSAPVLLTKQNEIPKEVIDQLKELETKTVYIVGGETVVSQNVVDTLQKTYGITVKRLAGDNRYETSLAVAKEFTKTANAEEAFIVGGHGEADALSAAGIAGELKAPILLTPAEGINKDVELFLNTKVNPTASAKDITVIGGTTVVSENAYNQLLTIDADVKRVAGERRQDTNAAVIKEFYAPSATVAAPVTVDNMIVAKADNKGLVDALGAGALSADKGNTPVVLSGENLSDNQEDVLATVKVAAAGKKVQVGYGVSQAVAKFVKSIVKL